MDMTQVYSLMNNVTSEILGDSALLAEDLSNVVDIGKSIFDATSYDHYVATLVDHVGRVVFVNRVYKGATPSVMRDGWEYGAVLEKITVDALPAAEENSSWSLTNGVAVNQDVFKKPTVSAKFFNKRVTFEIDLSITDKQCRSAFSSAEQLNAFVSMIYNAIETSMTVKLDSLIERTINNLIANTIFDDYPGGNYSASSGIKAVNLLKLYNDQFGTTLSAAAAIYEPEFIRFASLMMRLYVSRLSKISTLFNVGGKARFTATDKLHIILLNQFVSAAGAYLQSDTFHDEFTSLMDAEIVPYWQGSGTDYSFTNCSTIHALIDDGNGSTEEINVPNVIGVMFDHDACGVANLDRRMPTHRNDKGEFTNLFAKMDAGYFNDLNENCVVFFLA